jgi:hypothetical protein
MKNLFLIPTDKPSRLQLQMNGNFHIENGQTIALKSFQNIYITSDETPNKMYEGFYLLGNKVFNTNTTMLQTGCKAIILTTDRDLIKNGVQAIDDTFLEWFVKNPSCEKVEVKEKQHFESDKTKRDNPLNGVYYCYKIIIPKEKQSVQEYEQQGLEKSYSQLKRETLEEVAEKLASTTEEFNMFIAGAKWQAEKSYSEEDMLKFAWFLIENVGQYSCDRTAHFEGKYLEQFKKKV